MKIQTVSYIGAAQRLGISIEKVKELVKSKELKESEPGRVTLESVYAYSGMKLEGRQTVNRRGRKTAVVSHQEAATMLGIDAEVLQDLIRSGELELYNAEITKRSVEKRLKKMEEGEKCVAHKSKTEDHQSEQTQTNKNTDAGIKDADATAKGKPEAEGKDQEDQSAPKTDAGEEGVSAIDIDAFMQEFFPGIKPLAGSMRKAAIKAASQKEYTRSDMREAGAIAYMRGKLSVYESLSEFKRREYK